MTIDPAIQRAGREVLGVLMRACRGGGEIDGWTQADIDEMVEAQLDVPLELPPDDPQIASPTPRTARQLLDPNTRDPALIASAARYYSACAEHPESDIPQPVAQAIAHRLQQALGPGPPNIPPS